MPHDRATLISIIVPVYNVEKYLPRCVESVLKQTHTNIEVILVDDGSPDRCPEMCDEYERRDSRVKAVHQVNAGLSAARNAGIDIVSGEFIGFVDGDDYISENMYEELYVALADNDADMSICNFKYVGDGDTDLDDNSNLPIQNGVLTGIDIITKKIDAEKQWYWVIAWNKLYKRDLFSDIRYPVGKLHEDEFVLHKLLLKCNKVACVSKMLYFYLQRNSGITRSVFNIRRLDSAEAHFERARAYLSEGIDAFVAYHACAVGLAVMANSYTQLSFEDNQYKERYKELTAQYRFVAQKLLETDLPILIKIRLMLNRVSPFYAWKLLERSIKAISSRKNLETIINKRNSDYW